MNEITLEWLKCCFDLIKLGVVFVMLILAWLHGYQYGWDEGRRRRKTVRAYRTNHGGIKY